MNCPLCHVSALDMKSVGVDGKMFYCKNDEFIFSERNAEKKAKERKDKQNPPKKSQSNGGKPQGTKKQGKKK